MVRDLLLSTLAEQARRDIADLRAVFRRLHQQVVDALGEEPPPLVFVEGAGARRGSGRLRPGPGYGQVTAVSRGCPDRAGPRASLCNGAAPAWPWMAGRGGTAGA